jgi:hypothetical protein
MQRKYLRAPALAAALAVVLSGVSCGHKAPAGQAALENLTPQNLAQVVTAFNTSKGEVRLLLLLSPT